MSTTPSDEHDLQDETTEARRPRRRGSPLRAVDVVVIVVAVVVNLALVGAATRTPFDASAASTQASGRLRGTP